MDDILIPIVVVGILFLGLPWLVFHYITKWKTAATLTTGDEKLLDELHEAAPRLDDRLAASWSSSSSFSSPGVSVAAVFHLVV